MIYIKIEAIKSKITVVNPLIPIMPGRNMRDALVRDATSIAG